jgi:hypothetical protein
MGSLRLVAHFHHFGDLLVFDSEGLTKETGTFRPFVVWQGSPSVPIVYSPPDVDSRCPVQVSQIFVGSKVKQLGSCLRSIGRVCGSIFHELGIIWWAHPDSRLAHLKMGDNSYILGGSAPFISESESDDGLPDFARWGFLNLRTGKVNIRPLWPIRELIRQSLRPSLS